MKKSTDKWYIKVFEPTEHPDGGFVANYKIHWLYRFFMWLRLADKPIIRPLDLFSKIIINKPIK